MDKNLQRKIITILHILQDADKPLCGTRIAQKLQGFGFDLSQRTVRYYLQKMDLDGQRLPADFVLEKGQDIYHGAGCRECRGSGYAGRLGIFELLILDDEVRDLIVQRCSASRIRELAVNHGLRLLRADGWDKVRAGITTVEEVLRVTKA